MKNGEVVAYYLHFKNRNENSLRLSVEGGRSLIDALISDKCPAFLKVKGRLIAKYSIDQITPLMK